MAPPQVTSAAAMALNLDASEDTIPGGWDIANPGGTSNYSTAVRIYDPLGEAHQVQVYFTKTAAQAWTWNGVIDGSDVQGGGPPGPRCFTVPEPWPLMRRRDN